MKHTPGPWLYVDGLVRAPKAVDFPGETGGPIILRAERDDSIIRPTIRDNNVKRAVACVNGCDEAGIINPDKLWDCIEVALDAVAALNAADLSPLQRQHLENLEDAIRAVREPHRGGASPSN